MFDTMCKDASLVSHTSQSENFHTDLSVAVPTAVRDTNLETPSGIRSRAYTPPLSLNSQRSGSTSC